MEGGKSSCDVTKVKKKKVKDEFDRNKQAKKKKRRLEKALATSAAIISELERKKEKKKEEQQRLDEEGAAIAEAVALQVLIDEDPDEPGSWGCPRNLDLYMTDPCSRTTTAIPPGPDHQLSRNPNVESSWVFNAAGGSRCRWNGYGSSSEVQAPYFNDGCWEERIDMPPTELMVTHAVSLLKIVDDMLLFSIEP